MVGTCCSSRRIYTITDHLIISSNSNLMATLNSTCNNSKVLLLHRSHFQATPVLVRKVMEWLPVHLARRMDSSNSKEEYSTEDQTVHLSKLHILME